MLWSGTSWDSYLLVPLRHPLPVGSPALLCVYCLSRCQKIKCHSWRHFLFSISVVLSARSLCVSHNNASTSFGLGPAACNLDQKCQFYLINGLVPSTRRVYRPAEHQLIDFCTLDDHVSSNGSLLPTNEQTLLHFCSHLADCLHRSSIKVYLLAIRSLHIDQGFPGPLVNCLQLQRLLRGIERYQGSTLPQCQPVAANLMHCNDIRVVIATKWCSCLFYLQQYFSALGTVLPKSFTVAFSCNSCLKACKVYAKSIRALSKYFGMKFLWLEIR